jgi:hypothetical protein
LKTASRTNVEVVLDQMLVENMKREMDLSGIKEWGYMEFAFGGWV